MTLMDEFKRLAQEETEAYLEYSRLADDADDAGMHLTAENLRKIASEELNHSSILTRMWMEPELGPYLPGKPTLPGKPLPERFEPTRPFPQTYGNWVNLAEDIKGRYPDDPVMRGAANFSLGQILAEEGRSPGWSPEAAAEAKRWLTRKAGELGIK